ncbi:hypothetical protein ACK2J6_001237 [Vibrio fluvialis]
MPVYIVRGRKQEQGGPDNLHAGIFLAGDSIELFHMIDEYCDPYMFEYSQIKDAGAIGIGFMIESKYGREDGSETFSSYDQAMVAKEKDDALSDEEYEEKEVSPIYDEQEIVSYGFDRLSFVYDHSVHNKKARRKWNNFDDFSYEKLHGVEV